MNTQANPNVLYKKIYTRWLGKKNRWYLLQPIQNRYVEALKNRYRQLHPRAKKIDVTKLPESEVQAIHDQFIPIAQRRADRALNLIKAYETWLNNNAPGVRVEITDMPYQVDNAYTGAFSSQTQPEKYAQNAMIFSELKLQQRKIKYQIAENNVDYILIAYIEPWTFDAIKRSTFVSLMEWAITCWQRGVNPKVYDPFLPDNVFEQSCKVAMKG